MHVHYRGLNVVLMKNYYQKGFEQQELPVSSHLSWLPIKILVGSR